RLGVPLCLRVKKRLVLTAAGRKVVAAARRLLPQVVGLEEELRGHAKGSRGVLRLTTECYTSYDWLPAILKRFATRYPEVEVRIVGEATERALEALREGSVDLALMADPGDCERYAAILAADRGREVEILHLFDDEYLLAIAPGHPLAARRSVRAEDLRGERLLLYCAPRESTFCRHVLAPAGVTPRETIRVPLTQAILSWVRAGLGVAVLAAWAVESERGGGEVAFLRVGSCGLRRQWVAGIRRQRTPAYVRHFAELVAAEAGSRALEPALCAAV